MLGVSDSGCLFLGYGDSVCVCVRVCVCGGGGGYGKGIRTSGVGFKVGVRV